MDEDSPPLEDILGAVADGDSVDWDALERKAGANEDLRRLIRDLRLISDVANVHRAPADASGITRPEPAEKSTTVPPISHDGPRPGSKSEHWRHLVLIRKIGEGSFGEVFHAHDPWLDHAVALKLLKPNLTHRSRLLHEARTLAKIRHENIVRVHGVDVHEGRIGFWMEFIRGQTLDDVVLHEGVRSASEAVAIGQELCRALAAVHAQNIVHRDIKAKNVMRELDSGRIVLMDFGAGELIESSARSRSLTGTPLYLAPELFDGSAATRQSDIYALGVLLFHLVTKRYPVNGNSIDGLIRAHQRGERTHLGDLRPDLPDGFVRVVEMMLSPDPGNRYATARAAREALEGALVGARDLDSRASGEGTGDRTRRRSGIGPLGVGASVLGGILTLTLAGIVTSTLYESPIGLTQDSGAVPPLLWPVWGFRALFALTLLMTAIAAMWALLRLLARTVLGAVPLLRTLWHRATARPRALAERSISRLGSSLAGVILLMQILATAAVAWWFRALFGGLDSYITQGLASRLAALSPANRSQQDLFEWVLAGLVLVVGLAWVRLIRRRPEVWSTESRAYLYAGIAGIVLTVLLCKVVPFRILYHNDAERVTYESRRCYLVGQRDSEARLFCPHQSPPWNRVVRMDDPALKREGIVENIFSGFASRQ